MGEVRQTTATKLQIQGLDELDKRLQQIPEKFRRKIIREVMKAAAEPVRAEIERRAPRGKRLGKYSSAEYGRLSENIVASGPRTKADGSASIQAGPGKDQYWGIFLEFGTVKLSARPFVRPAFDSKYQEALDVMFSEIHRFLEKQGIPGTGR